MVFNRIASFDNLDAVKNIADMSQRITIYGSITDSLAAIIVLYASATRPSSSFDAEIVDLATIYMEDIDRTYDIANELLLSLPPDNQLRKDEPAFRQKFSAGTSAMFAIFFTILSDREEMRRSELLRLAHALRKYLDLLKSQVLAGSMEEIRVKVNDLMNSETDEGLKEALSSLLSAIGG